MFLITHFANLNFIYSYYIIVAIAVNLVEEIKRFSLVSCTNLAIVNKTRL